MSRLIAVNDASFETRVLQSPKPVLVEFGAEWCGPCKAMEPLLEQLGAEWGERIELAKVDADEAVHTAMSYQVMGLPTFILFVNGQPKERLSGKQSREKLVEKISAYL